LFSKDTIFTHGDGSVIQTAGVDRDLIPAPNDLYAVAGSVAWADRWRRDRGCGNSYK
jgi:hypothetical protein